ncbi:serine/threonine-protein kinase [Rhodococcus erythropolis]|uniref:serine/threonine-protein kinase n=1 Tax=Rhodococcus erythropolis TaxID=1833 RepID=UPI0040415B22
MEKLVVEGAQIQLGQRWTIGDRIGSGGFGQVFAVRGDDGGEAVAKFVPQVPGAGRELLFVNPTDVRNVVPVIDCGEYAGNFVLVMPRADLSLREHLDRSGGTLSIDETVGILGDIADALADLDGKVVHRDLKPENVLRLGGQWCLADFGISRYAEASTAPDTHKFAMTPHYAAPERWRNEHATIAADMYALGVIAYEMLAGGYPFDANTVEDLRIAHLHSDPKDLVGVPTVLATLVEECLYKAPATRPSPENFRARLTRHRQRAISSPGLMQLQEANHAEVRQRAEAARRASEAKTADETRSELVSTAKRSFLRLSHQLRDELMDSAPSGDWTSESDASWRVRLGQASLTFNSIRRQTGAPWGGWQVPAFDVAAFASLSLRVPADRYAYEGRSHSLWFGDIQKTGEYGWYETAFMVSPMVNKQGRQDPFALDPGEESAKAVWTGMAEYQVAWPFTRLHLEDLDEFIGRWASWLGQAATGSLNRPSTMPERSAEGTWRRS